MDVGASVPKVREKMIRDLVKIAEQYIGIREVGNNAGPEILRFQMAVDGKAEGESWCMGFVQFCIQELEHKIARRSNIFRSEHCLTVWNKSPLELRREIPEPGYIVIWRHGDTTNGHTGIVARVIDDKSFETIEGNTSGNKDVDRNGDGVYLKTRLFHSVSEMQIVGYLSAFEEN
jgi:hypothetical protein